MKNKVLVGATKNGEIVFAETEIRSWNGHPEFSASFDTVTPFRGNDIDLECYFEDYADARCMGAEYVLNLLEEHDCSPSELPGILASECNDPRDAMDCSLYPKEYDIDGELWYFESCGCGQHDTTEEMDIFVNREAYNTIMELWKKYHLQEIPEAAQKELETAIEILSATDEEEWIKSFIQDNN